MEAIISRGSSLFLFDISARQGPGVGEHGLKGESLKDNALHGTGRRHQISFKIGGSSRRALKQQNPENARAQKSTLVCSDSRGSATMTQSRESLNNVLEAALRLERQRSQTENPAVDERTSVSDELWLTIRSEAREDAEAEPALASFLYSTILAHRSLERALAFHLGNKLSSSTLLSTQLYSLISDMFMDDSALREALRADLRAARERDPACITYSQCLLNFKGFLAIQAHRVAHRLWVQGRQPLALALQSRVSEVFHVDIHPAAKVGQGVLLDHATGVVVGETAEIGNNVSILHHVTLGGTGALGKDRHPKVRDGVLIGAGATILGNITVGEGAKIGAGSIVLKCVPPHTTAVGNPARLIGGKSHPAQLKEMPSETMDHTSFINAWSDYTI